MASEKRFQLMNF